MTFVPDDAAGPREGADDRGLAPAVVVKGATASKENVRLTPTSVTAVGRRPRRSALAVRGCHLWRGGPLRSIRVRLEAPRARLKSPPRPVESRTLPWVAAAGLSGWRPIAQGQTDDRPGIESPWMPVEPLDAEAIEAAGGPPAARRPPYTSRVGAHVSAGWSGGPSSSSGRTSRSGAPTRFVGPTT